MASEVITWEVRDNRSQRIWRGVAPCVRDAQTACQTTFRSLGRLELTGTDIYVTGTEFRGKVPIYRAVRTKRGSKGLVLCWVKQ